VEPERSEAAGVSENSGFPGEQCGPGVEFATDREREGERAFLILPFLLLARETQQEKIVSRMRRGTSVASTRLVFPVREEEMRRGPSRGSSGSRP